MAHLLVIILATIEESIKLNEVKNDLLNRNWEGLKNILQNYVKCIYTLQRLKIMIESKDV